MSQRSLKLIVEHLADGIDDYGRTGWQPNLDRIEANLARRPLPISREADAVGYPPDQAFACIVKLSGLRAPVFNRLGAPGISRASGRSCGIGREAKLAQQLDGLDHAILEIRETAGIVLQGRTDVADDGKDQRSSTNSVHPGCTIYAANPAQPAYSA